MSSPRHIDSTAPFSSAARDYIKAGWDVVPLPPHQKRTPPKGFTGRKNKGRYVTELDLQRWFKCTEWEDVGTDPNTGQVKRRPPWAKGNIAVHPGREVEFDGNVWEIIGIDVDDYGDKHGWTEIKKLEKDLGLLPDTWISSARSDFRSGIRWYLVPYGFEFRGKVADSIEVVQHVHRYGIVWPSWHPETKSQYFWYEPGQLPNGRAFADQIPNVTTLSVLPEMWFDYLRKGVRQTGTLAIDEDILTEDLKQWTIDNLSHGKEMCRCVSNHIKKWLKEFGLGSDHHDPLVAGHWNLFCLGAEGHTGALKAVGQMQKAWMKRLEDEGDSSTRNLWIAKAELLRSREGALRRLKGDVDSKTRELEPEDPCSKPPPPPSAQNPNVTPASMAYERNEDGNAQHFLDLFGENLRYVPNYPSGNGKWIVFHEDIARWVVDDTDTLVRNMFRQVKDRQQTDAEFYRLANVGNQAMQKTVNAWLTWALGSGNKERVTNSLAQATTFTGVIVDFEDLDAHPYLIPVANGVIKFHTKAERLSGADAFEWVTDAPTIKSYMLTQNTNVPYIPFAQQKSHENPSVRANFIKFRDQMYTFLKNDMSPEVWEYTLRLLGFSILGINPKKAVFLVGAKDTGKSTFQNMMNAALGDLSLWREPRILLDTRFKSALAEALSRRVCMVGELGEKTIDAGLFKRITGNDEVSCELKGVNRPVTLRARCVLISGCNDAPDVPNVDAATKSRFVVIPFKHRVPSDKKDEGAQDDLMEHCKVPLLSTLIEKCAEAIMTGIHVVPDELQMATKVFVSGLNELSDFIDETMVIAPPSEWDKYALKGSDDPRDPKPRWPDEKCCSTKELFDRYRRYAAATGMDPMSSNKLTRRLKAVGFVQDGSKGKDDQLRWIGITLTGKLDKVKEVQK